MYTIDASVWLNSYDAQEPGHEEAHQFLALLASRKISIYVPTLVLVEVAAAISRSKQQPEQGEAFAEALNQIATLHLISLDEQLAKQAQRLAARRKLRGADAVYAAVAVQMDCTLITTDKEHLTRLADIVTAQTPVEALARLATNSNGNQE